MIGRRWIRLARQRAGERTDIARLLPRAGAAPVALLAGANLLLGALAVTFAVATAQVLGAVAAAVAGGPDSAAWRSLVTVFWVAAAAFVARQLIVPVERTLAELVVRRIDGQVYDELIEASLRSSGLAPLEDQQALDALRTAAREVEFGVRSPGRAAAGLLALIARYTELAGYTVAVAVVFSWPAAAGLLTTVLLFRRAQRGGLRAYAVVRSRLAADEREIDYLRRLAGGTEAAKEIRVFGLLSWLRQRLRETHLRFLEPLWTQRRRIYLWPFLRLSVVALAVTGVVFAILGATGESLTLAGFVLTVQAGLGMLRLAEHYPEADLPTVIGCGAQQAVQRFSARVDACQQAVPGPRRAEVPEVVGTIRFDGVGFGYPGRRGLVFDGVDLTIPAGRCTAVVGLNGAGKTTLVKLLARLYEPEAGAIRVDGVDIREFPVEAWRARLSMIFQDFVRDETSIADNIALGAMGFRADRETIREVAEAVGLGATLGRLPLGLDTPLGRHRAGGTELSGGQWQRVALARALFGLRHGASIAVLDEPTASLDVRAEAGFFHRFAGLTRGATTLLISHRFATVRHADLIVVLERGQVLEQGDHSGLLARGGRYAELFRLQANRFAGDGALR